MAIPDYSIMRAEPAAAYRCDKDGKDHAADEGYLDHVIVFL